MEHIPHILIVDDDREIRDLLARFLEQNGFADVINVAGGIDAWSQTVDPAVPRY